MLDVKFNALSGSPSAAEMRRGFARLRLAIAGLYGADFRVVSDERQLRPLSQAAADVQAEAKAYCAAAPGFRGNAVLVTDPITMMQTRRTSRAARIDDSELVSSDAEEVERFIGEVKRAPRAR